MLAELRLRLRMKLRDLAYPHFTCEDCLGVGSELGISYTCFCQMHGAEAPAGRKLPLWRRILQRFVTKQGR